MSTVEERLSALESAIEDVKHQLADRPKSSAWLEQVVGSHEEWPEFDEVLQLGREFRRSSEEQTEDNSGGA